MDEVGTISRRFLAVSLTTGKPGGTGGPVGTVTPGIHNELGTTQVAS